MSSSTLSVVSGRRDQQTKMGRANAGRVGDSDPTGGEDGRVDIYPQEEVNELYITVPILFLTLISSPCIYIYVVKIEEKERP